MCTLTYIPVNNEGYLLTLGRDELLRSDMTTPPIEKKINGHNHLFPVEPVTGGTWIGISENDRAVCVIRGGKNKYQTRHPNGQALGQLIPVFFCYDSFKAFYKDYRLDDLEPFTMIAIEKGKVTGLFREPDKIIVEEPDPRKAAIYSSANLFSNKEILERTVKFGMWINSHPEAGFDDVLELHDSYRIDREGPVRINSGRDLLSIVSITCVIRNPDSFEMTYIDRINDFRFSKKLSFSQPGVIQ